MQIELPTEKAIRAILIRRVDEYVRLTGKCLSLVSKEAVGDPAFMGRLKAGRDLTFSTYGRVQKYLTRKWPRSDRVARS